MSFLLYNAPAACNFYGIIRPLRNMNSPYDASEQPDYTIKMPLELLGLVDRIEAGELLPKDTTTSSPGAPAPA